MTASRLTCTRSSSPAASSFFFFGVVKMRRFPVVQGVITELPVCNLDKSRVDIGGNIFYLAHIDIAQDGAPPEGRQDSSAAGPFS